MPKRFCEVLPVANRAGLRVAHAACCDEDILRTKREVLCCDEEAVLERRDCRDCAVREDRHFFVAQQVAERMDYRRRFFVGGEEPSVCHALCPHAERLEPAANLPRRAFAHRLSNELCARPFAQVAEELVGGNVLCEVAAAVRRHQHLRAESRLAFDHDAGDVSLGGDRRREHSRRATSYDGELYGSVVAFEGERGNGSLHGSRKSTPFSSK